ncbi:uncharacterized protein LOC111686155 [Lucilia cuprina]|uniref:uncharacterized protein LOC111686155 n=1 Tax=Lucilia cuprina TaxID=7375 RepID=UPI001F0573EF|nr:uncharacterized protein LOC111686155 [Lucilia cuprina]
MIIKFTKLECQAYDKSFAEFKMCQLKVIGRDKIALNIHANLHEKPLNNITLSAQLFRKSNDFRPFLYNDTFDFCLFMKNSNRFLFWKTLVQDLSHHSNINHTCPYDHDIIVNNMVLEEGILKHLPFPSNDYMIQLKFWSFNDLKARVKIYIVIVE